jgi:hypothetical protein
MTNTATQPTCADLVGQAFESRIEDIRVMLTPTDDDVVIFDDGTLDTVGSIGDIEFRYVPDSGILDEDTGDIDFEQIVEDHRDQLYDAFYEYGLSVDYVPHDGEFNDGAGYHSYQISYGGPSEEFRFYCDPSRHCYRVEFWYLDWFDGACINVTNDSRVQMLVEQFAETEVFSND